MLNSYLLFTLVATKLVFAVPLLEERSDKRSCTPVQYNDLALGKGTCETKAACQKYISLPEQVSDGLKCSRCSFPNTSRFKPLLFI